MNNRLIKSNDAGGGACTNTVDLYNPFPDGGGVALYQLNGDATDVSGNYDGTASNVTYGAGQFGQAGVFNGSSSYVGMATNSWNSFTSYTASFWIYDTGTATGGRTMVSNYGYTAASNVEKGWIIMRVGTKLRISNATTGLASTYLSTNDIPFNQWAHIVVTNTQSEIKIYFNGVLDSTHTTNGFLNDASWPMRPAIGVYRYETTETRNGYFNGSIDQVRIFSRALRPYEVEALYTEEYCTPTIVPSEHFNTVLYSGNSGTQSITSVGFAPDLTWIKERTGTDHHRLQDTVRGAGYRLYSSTTSAEGYTNDSITSFDANGFSLGSSLGVNESGQNYVAWNFKAGGAAVTNTDGTITSQVSANTEAGFSIVTWTGSFTTGQTVGHGLGQAPKIIMARTLDRASNLWYVSHPEDNTKSLILSSTAAENSDLTWVKGDDTFGANWTGTSFRWLAYCFAEVEGFSNFGSYVGTGASGNTIVTGFEPAFVMIKRTDSTGNWFMLDNKRDNTNPNNLFLLANAADTEKDLQTTDALDFVNFLENGFEVLNGGAFCNASGASYIYMAFAADPTAVEPTLEDSFNTVTYTGNGGANSITGVGFQPDFTWIKSRVSTNPHNLFDSIRGAGFSLMSNLTAAEIDETGYFTSFDADGFSFGLGGGNTNFNGYDYVAWNWKGAEIPAINSNGSIPSVVSANPAAGFSIVSWNGNASTATIGHGLGLAPKMIITKARNVAATRWNTFHASVGTGKYLSLDTANAASTFALAWPTLPDENVWYMSIWENYTGENYISYCFAEVAGFSKFGIYNGTGVNGNFIATGFEPAFVMVKRTNAADNWVIVDNKRGTSNSLFPDLSSQELFNSGAATFSSTGFTVNGASGGWNNSSSTYIYMAFANQF